MAKKSTSRAPGKTQISISLPADLVGKIDRMADVENRNRSNFIATHLERLADGYQVTEPTVQFTGGKRRKK
jgi:metal-responsive CopG/Arc/MetJ family transcriptional regulator